MKIHFKIPAWGSLLLCMFVLTFVQIAPCQSLIDRLAYQTGIGAASRAHVHGMLPSSTIDTRNSNAFRQYEEQHYRIDRSFTRIRVKNLHRIFTRIKLNRIKIKL